MISPAKALVVILILLGFLRPAAAEVLRLDYEGFAVWLDCERRGEIPLQRPARPGQSGASQHGSAGASVQAPTVSPHEIALDRTEQKDGKVHRKRLGQLRISATMLTRKNGPEAPKGAKVSISFHVSNTINLQ